MLMFFYCNLKTLNICVFAFLAYNYGKQYLALTLSVYIFVQTKTYNAYIVYLYLNTQMYKAMHVLYSLVAYPK